MAYATVSELEERWRDLSESEKRRAAALLDDAAALLDSELERCHQDPSTKTDKLRYISCQMVRRAMAGGEAGDLTSLSRTAGSFSEQFSFANPSGDLYLTANERRFLGVMARGRIAQVGP